MPVQAKKTDAVAGLWHIKELRTIATSCRAGILGTGYLIFIRNKEKCIFAYKYKRLFNIFLV